MFSWIKSWFVNFFGLARIDPAIVECATEDEARAKAQMDSAALVATQVTQFATTGSMSPLIPQWGGFGVARYQSFDKARLGTVVLYNAQWFQATPLVHRLVQRDGEGFIASGDNNSRSENWERVTSANYLGEVITIYRWPKPEAKALAA